LSKDSKAQCQQIRTVSIERVSGRMTGSLDEELMGKINHAIRLHLAL
jgi:mRNA-degrading endonuclease toxin of MazEF toxin-antitoxin module